MLTKDCFRRNFIGACVAKGFSPTDKECLAFLYDVVKDEFTDEEFTAITKDVVLNENFYGKMPDISLWTARKKKSEKKSGDSAFLIARQAFQDKVMELVNNDYNTKQAVQDFNDSLTASEVAALSALGGLTALWASCRKDGVFIDEKADWTIRRIQDKFKEHYNAPADDRLRIAEEKDAEMLLKIENLTASAIKRIN